MKPMSEAQWKARDDARSLATAAEIVGDELRFKKAKSAARTMAKEIKSQAEEMQAQGRNLDKLAKGSYSGAFEKAHGKKGR